jgi:tRNA 2-thiouridine synthesizing protein A
VVADQKIDITHEVCPMTYVRVKLALERLTPGQVLCVVLRGAEPLRNVPRSLAEDGHEVMSLSVDSLGVGTLLVRAQAGG